MTEGREKAGEGGGGRGTKASRRIEIVCVCEPVRLSVSVCAYVCIYAYVSVYVSLCTHMCARVRVGVCACVCKCRCERVRHGSLTIIYYVPCSVPAVAVLY